MILESRPKATRAGYSASAMQIPDKPFADEKAWHMYSCSCTVCLVPTAVRSESVLEKNVKNCPTVPSQCIGVGRDGWGHKYVLIDVNKRKKRDEKRPSKNFEKKEKKAKQSHSS